MKRLSALWIVGVALISMLFSGTVKAQQINPVTWTFSTEQISESEFNLVMSGKIQNEWHLYTIEMDEGGPMPMYIEFDASDDYSLVGKITETPKPKEEHDEVFGVDVKYHVGKVVYKQKIKANTDKEFTIKGLLDGQACYDVDGQCVLVTEDLAFTVKPVKATTQEETPVVEEETNQDENEIVAEESTENTSDEEVIADATEDTEEKEETTEEEEEEEKGFLGFFLLAIGGGLLGVLTPCVFPMIPMTVSFFLQGQSSRASGIMKAVVFGLSIMFLYTLLGLIVSLTSAGADLTTTLSSSWIANAIFFTLFFIFALSFFGLFEITLPSGLANKADQQVDKGGILASFFMAVTLVLVSFSCTGPIVGAILVKGAASGSWIEPTVGMLGFGFGFALPFTFLAASPSMLKKLPKSGGWMNSVKVVFAFILLAFSMKFLSNISETYGLGFLSRDIYIAIWIVLFILLGLYLMGKIKFSHDSELKHVGIFRLFLIIASFTFAIYLVPGLFGARLQPISSVLPPYTSQNFTMAAVSAPAAHSDEASHEGLCEAPKYGDKFHFDYGIQGYFDFEQGLDCAKEKKRPLLVYFSGHGCTNCKTMQSLIWEDSKVQEYLNNEVILTKLYTDDKTKLPEKEWYVSENDGREKKTLGKQNLDFQISKFNINSQPLYVLIDPETGEKLIEETMSFEKDTEKFIEFLDKGLKAME